MSFNRESITQPSFRSHENLWSFRLTATGLRSTAPLFEKLRDETCLHECLLLSLLHRSSSSSLSFSSFSFPPFALEDGIHALPPFLLRVMLLFLSLLYSVPLLSLALNPLDHLPPRRWKVCWFARWPVVSTLLHMVTYHQSTPTTRFAPRTPWIFMGRK